ncbi:DUF1428 domain-containing protein [Brevundimonas goettingensis]|uniref:DUF1428 domain-containing protein n=1 Tax=Brevundimonas goettingensis TaxID=2774190 RepID=A0A975GYI8_9CAUL|nr:DUF1428 domain-containing protein [Brevundimonas goettingensis]QTC91630.1 DUF1428 domain-containing protein [Brevundimonas goettingensis]
MDYVDGFIIAVKKDRIEDYKRIAEESAQIFKELGALSVVECVADDVPYGKLTSFPRAVMAEEDEIVVFSWITYPSREVRDEANTRMMENEKMAAAMNEMPVDGKRMIFGGFKQIVSA